MLSVATVECGWKEAGSRRAVCVTGRTDGRTDGRFGGVYTLRHTKQSSSGLFMY